MDPIEEAPDKANTSAIADSGFHSALHTLKQQIDGEIQNELFYIIALLESIDAEHPLLEALRGYQRWENEHDYEDGAKHALKNYEEGIDQALDDCWFHVASWSLAAYIDLADSLNHEDWGLIPENTECDVTRRTNSKRDRPRYRTMDPRYSQRFLAAFVTRRRRRGLTSTCIS